MVDEKKEGGADPAVSVKKKRGGMKFRQRFLLMIIVLVAAAFLPVTLVIIVGMIPSVVAFMADPTRQKTRAFTVALLNFVTCFPFLLDIALAQPGPTMDMAVYIITDPLKIVIMFAGAAGGYFLDWTMAGISNVIMTGRARSRLDAIDKRQEELVRRWGSEVTGKVPVDADGFPLIEANEAPSS